ncbi:MAG: polyprenyl synthetase family protein [Saprospiraceae bacterium]|nr:polyprenyl synthetase family protein [Saprospiraceae bacterium]
MDYLFDYTSSFQRFVNAHVLGDEPSGLYDPAKYILSLGGKRIRPVLALLGCHLYHEDYNKAMKAAMSVEVFHNFTLVHDDIMDNASIRRGQPTVHEKFSANQAILTGDVMLIHAYEMLLSYQPISLSHRLLSIFNKMSVELCVGQQMDMDFEKSDSVSIGDYIRMIELKTAVLLGASLQMGALIGGAGEDDASHLYLFALNFGIAFQLQDDVLDTFGTNKSVGKRIGGDIIQNKKTYLYLKALELADEHQKKNLLYMYDPSCTLSEEEKIAAVTDIFSRTGVREYASQVMEAYRDLAISHVHSCAISQEKKDVLIRFVNDLLYRES